MKDEEKQIEEKIEMARIIAFDLCPNGKYHNKLYYNKPLCYSNYNFAECSKIEDVVDNLYNAGYRKIPKDSVVLKRNEAIGSPSYVRGYQDGGKETAEKFTNLPNNEILTVVYDYEEIKVVKLKKLQEIAEQFGVEIKE